MDHIKRRHLITTGYHLPYNPDLKERARTLRRGMTKPEKKLWHGFLRKLDITVLRQKPIDNFIVDFYIASFRLVIEVDGESHCSENGIIYDSQRTAILEGYGLTILRFTNAQIIKRFNDVCREIEDKLNPPFPPLIKGGARRAGD
ncbi:MAG: endonuclease domain-containing protein [Candidatus Margulisiibacteriota bacterium]